MRSGSEATHRAKVTVVNNTAAVCTRHSTPVEGCMLGAAAPPDCRQNGREHLVTPCVPLQHRLLGS